MLIIAVALPSLHHSSR